MNFDAQDTEIDSARLYILSFISEKSLSRSKITQLKAMKTRNCNFKDFSLMEFIEKVPLDYLENHQLTPSTSIASLPAVALYDRDIGRGYLLLIYELTARWRCCYC